MATATYDGFKGFDGVLAYLIKGTVESDLHGRCELHNVAGTILIYAAIGGEKAHHHGMGTELTAQSYILTNDVILLSCIAKVALAGTHEYMGAEVQLVDTIADIVG